MKRLHRRILATLPGPFFGWLGTLMFLLLMQFLIRYLPDIVGKGLPVGVIVELVAYNLAYMVVLAVPMSALIATLMAFGRLGETNAYMVVKSAGISLPRLLWPILVVGGFLVLGMWYFNNEVLPEANFRAKNLWQDIRRKKPGFDLRPGQFYEGLGGYSMLVQEAPPPEEGALLFDVTPPGASPLRDVLIYDYTAGARRQVVIKANEGWIEPVSDSARMTLVLLDGEVHRRPDALGDRYERLRFERTQISFDLADLQFERSDPREGYRSDRTMRTSEMVAYVDSMEARVGRDLARMAESHARLLRGPASGDAAELPPTAWSAPLPADTSSRGAFALLGLSPRERQDVVDAAMGNAQERVSEANDLQMTVVGDRMRIVRHKVEIHKKRSIAVACLIFILIGAPLGLSIRRGGLGMAGALAVAIFLFYWITLVQGEKLADRGYLPPWFGMWIANAVMIAVGSWLLVHVGFDLGATRPLHLRLWDGLRRLWRSPAEEAARA